MARPSQQIDQALLRSGRALFPAMGCAGLSLRAVTDHAGVNAGMFHYHFKSKDNFLRVLLQQMYEEMFTSLSSEAAHQGTALERLRGALIAMARFARTHRRVLARVWMDATSGEAVAREFFRANAPRHLSLLFGLLEQARAEGALRELPPLQRFAFMMGSVLLPIIFVAGLIEAGVTPPAVPWSAFDAQVLSDAAIEQRVDLVLAVLSASDAPARGPGEGRDRISGPLLIGPRPVPGRRSPAATTPRKRTAPRRGGVR